MKRPICYIALLFIFLIILFYYLKIPMGDYEKVWKSLKKENNYEGIIVNEKGENEYSYEYIVKLQSKNKKLNNKRFILKTKKKGKKLSFGDKIKFTGEYVKPTGRRNYHGFDYSLYLKTQKLYGTFEGSNYIVLSTSCCSYVEKIVNNFKEKTKKALRDNLDEDLAELCIGILIGDRGNLEDKIEEDFKKSNLTHMLAVSGSHFVYIISCIKYLEKVFKWRNFNNVLTIIIIILFMELTGNTASVVRSGIMAIMLILAKVFHRKSDVWTNMAVSVIASLVYNPYTIFDIGFELSYGGVMGIVIFYDKVKAGIERTFLKRFKKRKILQYIEEGASVTISANLVIIPIMMYNFNTISFSFIISNLLAGGLLGIIVILGFLLVFLSLMLGKTLSIFFYILNFLLKALTKIAEVCSKLPFSYIYVPTPKILGIFIFYYYLFRYMLRKSVRFNNMKVRAVILVLIIIFNLGYPILSSKRIGLEINFIDVGQGDCTLIRANGKSILVDAGGSKDEKSFDVGKNTVFPYLLDRGIVSLDYVIVSHFDSDHCQGFNFILKNMKVKTAIICNIGQESEEYNHFVILAKENKTKIRYVQKGSIIKLGKNKIIEILYPDKNEKINDNAKNNNAIVFKLTWNKFSMLFTGDIEEKAERKILEMYKNKEEKLKSNILKVAHHGSKSSTMQEFLEIVKPSLALIGVGENNNFGHPNDMVLNGLEQSGCKTYRTDMLGEITITSNGKSYNVK